MAWPQRFLAGMKKVFHSRQDVGVIEPCYPKRERGRPPVGLEWILRMFLVQQWYPLSDERVEDAVTDIHFLREFVGVDLSTESLQHACEDDAGLSAPAGRARTDQGGAWMWSIASCAWPG